MADYYPLIARAISGLDANAPGEQRRALYERARSALIAQLRSVQPPLTESEITRERLSLEEAVRKVEAEAAQRAREASRSRNAPRSQATPTPQPSAAPTRPRSADIRPDSPRPPRDLRNPPRPLSSPPQPQAMPAPPSPEGSGLPPADPPSFPPRGALPPRRPQPPASSPNGDTGNGGNLGIRGFRDVTADVDDLGRATAQAGRNARKTFANVPSPSPEFDRLEPSMEDRGADPDYGTAYNAPDDAGEAPRFPPPPRDRADRSAPNEPRPPRSRSRPPKPLRGAFPLKSAIGIGIVMILIGAGILWGPRALQMLKGLSTTQPATVEAPKDVPNAPRPKIADRVGQPGAEAPVAQRVVLYDEDPSDPKGKQYVGTVVWRTEQVKGAGNDVAVRADIDIPERKFKMSISFRRNTDSSLPASHTAELTFTLPADFASGGVSNVPGILMKSNEQARGTPLAGLAVKVTDGFFLVGLSNVESDRARNLQLLKERSWFDIPLVYANRGRAIIAVEKGAPGERAFVDAFASWGE